MSGVSRTRITPMAGLGQVSSIQRLALYALSAPSALARPAGLRRERAGGAPKPVRKKSEANPAFRGA